ncbi:MAG: cobaltochelatase subunit CobN, partial [Shackletoniella antarctica]
PTLLPTLDTYLCDLKEAQIRDGLHIFGQCPDGRQLRDLVVAIARHPSPSRQGLTRALAESWRLDFDPLTAEPGDAFTGLENCRILGDAIALLEAEAARLVEELIQNSPSLSRPHPSPLPGVEGTGIRSSPPLPGGEGPGVRANPLAAELQWIERTLLPALARTTDEIANLLAGLDGRYVPSGPAGAPSRNRPDVLPTGRNFFSVDIRAIPTESAWDVGRRAAEVLVEQYTQDHGDYPQTLGLSVWGTSTMRTGGDDIAEALALMGVRPVWDGPSRRVVDFEVLPLSALGRPRVDVTLRISGFFRDAFPNLIDLFDQAVAAVASLEEPTEQNPLAARVRQESAEWQAQGLTAEQAGVRSRYRIFGSKPGAYGAGLQGLIESQNWSTDEDLARAYLNWSSYAYGRNAQGRAAPEAFAQRLEQMQVVLHNQDNREHDLLDSDDYYQFQGGMTVAARSLQGRSPATYFGDNAVTAKPKVRSLAAEIAKVYRSRVVNPKWIEGVMRHGYKGAFEMAATVDYLFAYDATTHCVADHMYEGVAQAYVLDPQVQAFVQQSNPWALRDMAERLLEANQRGLWGSASDTLLDALRQVANEAEGILETRQE